MDFKRVYEELNSLLLFSTNVEMQQSRREQMAVMSFLAGLPAEFDAARTYILSSPEIRSLRDVFTWLLQAKNPHPPSTNFALVSRSNCTANGHRGGKGGWNGHGGRHNGDTSGSWGHGSDSSSRPTSYHCGEVGHTKRTCCGNFMGNPYSPQLPILLLMIRALHLLNKQF
ncbi:uncharacterized protein LOC127797740 [Diospyros lotus]|uniref:uncharacterized protein LOC127797740 n=1 Tax=Diospyros lotus TaxID=55363 RepID=UPI00225BC7FB|nr:uncharacterized protein LOC127797740 [Diospyros lotus]